MATLIEDLPQEIARLEAKYGPDNRFVKDLKEQLRASKATQGTSAQQVWRAQAVPLKSVAGAPSTSASEMPETEAEGQALGAKRLAMFKHQNEQFAKMSKQ